ncbi:MAG: hypothetical protein R3B68_06120 [Phycisphaerales bacterium]
MTKFLRKYNKVLLVFAGIFLMVGFLVGPAIQQFGPNPGKRTVGYIGPGKARRVTAMDIGVAQVEVQLLQRFTSPMGNADRGQPILNFVSLDPDEEGLHWFLLTEEARRAGLVASSLDGAQWIPDLASTLVEPMARQALAFEMVQQSPGLASLFQQNPGLLNQLPQFNPQRYQELLVQFGGQNGQPGVAELQLRQRREQLAASAGMTLEQFDEAVTKLRGVMRLVTINLGAPAYSDRRSAAFAREFGDSAELDYLFITGSRLASEVGEPTPEQLQAHFQRYRDAEPGSGENGIGYIQPPRARLAWLTLDRAAIVAAVDQWTIPANADGTDPRVERWSTNRMIYPGTFTQEQANVERDLRTSKVAEIMDLARRTILQRAHEGTRSLEREGPYYVLTPSYQRPSLESIAATVAGAVLDQTGVAIPQPAVTILSSGWQTRDDLQTLPGIGRSAMRQGASIIPFPDAVLGVRELDDESTLGLQVGVLAADRPLEDSSGSQYFHVVLDVRDTGPAESIDEVIDQVRTDHIALRGYERLVARMDDLRRQAIEGDLASIAAQFPPENAAPENGEPAGPLAVQPGVPVSEMPNPSFPPPLGDEDFCQAAMAAARTLDPTVPAPAQPVEQRTIVQAIPSAMGVAVARVVWFAPITQEQYRGFAAGGMFNTVLREWTERADVSGPDLAMTAYTLDELKARWNWVEPDASNQP